MRRMGLDVAHSERRRSWHLGRSQRLSPKGMHQKCKEERARHFFGATGVISGRSWPPRSALAPKAERAELSMGRARASIAHVSNDANPLVG